MKINLYKVHNDFGDKLPSKGEFFANPNNEVTRTMLRHYYHNKGATDYRRYRWFVQEFNEFVASLKESKERIKKDKEAPKPSEVKKDAAK